jgi:acetyl-CoA carboxylase biotin carboxyl carrier protein
VADDLSSLSEDEVNHLVQIIESLENSAFDFLQLQIGTMKVALGKGNPSEYSNLTASQVSGSAVAPDLPLAALTVAAPAAPPRVPTNPRAATVPSVEVLVPSSPGDGTIEVRSPLMGIYYAQPEPGAEPFVTVGSAVDEDTTVALVEVMKMFSSVSAGVEGTVVAILVENAGLVEFGQALIRIQPA